MSAGPIPDLNKMQEVPNNPAERMTSSSGLSGMTPFGPIGVVRPVIVDPLRITLVSCRVGVNSQKTYTTI